MAAQLFARISSLPLDDPLDDTIFTEPLRPERITYLIDPTPPQRRRKRKQHEHYMLTEEKHLTTEQETKLLGEIFHFVQDDSAI